jgi:RNA polymerase sigma-70 factor (ECF subfamily)
MDAPLSARAEHAAVRGALRGDPAALDVLYRAHWPAAHRAAWLIVRDAHVAEDLAQEGFVAALGALDRFDRSRPFGPWLRTIVARRAIDAARARASRREVEPGPLDHLPAPPHPARPAPGDDLLAAVAALPPEQRAAVAMRHLLELTPGEIARLTGVPRGTVNSRLRRGLDALARAPGVVPVVALLVALGLALALTAPGRATAQWVSERIASAVDRAAGPAPRRAAPTAPLPGGGRLLSVTARGPVVLGLGAPRQLLGRVDEAAWSPHGRFVVAVRGIELIAVDLRGHRRWHVAPGPALHAPRWSPSGYRVAYLAGATGAGGRLLHVVNGDGTGDHAVGGAGAAAPAWHPSTVAHVLAYVDAAHRVVVKDVDTRAIRWRARPAGVPRALAWSRDGHRLVVADAAGVTTYAGGTGRRLGRRIAPSGTEDVAVAFAPYGRRYLLVRRRPATGEHRLLLVARGRERLLRAGPGTLRGAAWSPNGRWIALDVAGAPAWTLLRVPDGGPGGERTLAAGTRARLAGWCCSPSR